MDRRPLSTLKTRVYVFGTICIDRVYRIRSLPVPGGYSAIEGEEVFLGGEAANTANALHLWGVSISLVGNQLGQGEDSHTLLRLLVEHQLPTDHLRHGVAPTPVCHVYVTPDGERTMFGLGFGEQGQTVEPATIAGGPGEWFTADPNLGRLARDAAAHAAQAGMRLYLMDFIAEEDAFPPATFWQSSTDWVGIRGNTQKNVEWVQRHVDRHGCFTVLSDGPNGLVAGSPEYEVRAYPPYPCPKLVDSTGAGDMFRAGMLYGLNLNWDLSACLRFASAAGSLKCRALGATTDVPTVAEIEAHVAKHRAVSRHYEG